MQQPIHKRPSVIPRSDIPVSRASHHGDLEVRPFLTHKLLGSLLPPSFVSLAWTHAPAGKDIALRSHPTPGLLIILEGRAVLLGGLPRKVEAGDVVTLLCRVRLPMGSPSFVVERVSTSGARFRTTSG